MAGYWPERAVGVPAGVDVEEQALLRAYGENVPFVVDVRELVDVGVVRGDGERRLLQCAESLGELDLLLVVDALIAQHEYRVLIPRFADDLEARLVERLAQIDAGDLGADVGVKLGDGDT